jgi:hypothetical protein
MGLPAGFETCPQESRFFLIVKTGVVLLFLN